MNLDPLINDNQNGKRENELIGWAEDNLDAFVEESEHVTPSVDQRGDIVEKFVDTIHDNSAESLTEDGELSSQEALETTLSEAAHDILDY